MPARTLAIVLAACLVTACASGPSERPSARNTVTPGPQKVGVTEYLAFLDTLAESIRKDEPRPLTDLELDVYHRVDRNLRLRLDDVEDIVELPQADQVKIFNLHQQLEAVIIGDSKNRVICRREQRVGTHFRTTTCMTVQEFEDLQHLSQEWLRARTGPGPLLPNN